MRQVFGRNAGTVVRDGQPDVAAVASGAETDRAAGRSVTKRVGRQVLQRLFETHRIAHHPNVIVMRFDRDRDALVLRGLGVALEDALEDLVDGDVVQFERDAAGLESREVEQILDEAFDALALLLDHLDGALPFLRRRRELRQRQRLGIAANRGERRHQLMRDIGEQLTPRPIGFEQLRLARRQIRGHAVEGIGDGGHFISAGRRGTRREVAFAKPVGRVLQGAQPRLRGPEDDERSDRGAGDEQQDHAKSQRRADRLDETADARERRHPDHGHDRVVVLNRRDHRAATRRTEQPRPGAVRRRPSSPLEGRRTATIAGSLRTIGTAVRTSRTSRAASTPERPRKANASRHFGPFRGDRGSVRKNDRRRTMQLLDATLRIGSQIELGIAGERGFELGSDELGEIAAHAFGHAAFGFTRNPDEQADLQDQRDREEQDEAEADAPIEAA